MYVLFKEWDRSEEEIKAYGGSPRARMSVVFAEDVQKIKDYIEKNPFGPDKVNMRYAVYLRIQVF